MKCNTIYAWCRKVDTEQLVEAINEYCDKQETPDYIYIDPYGGYYRTFSGEAVKIDVSTIRLYFYNAVCDGDDETFREKIKEIIN